MINNNLTLQSQNLLQEIKEEESEIYTLIEIDNKVYAIETKKVLEIVKIMELDYPYALPSCVLGIMDYEQSPVAVIDLREVLKNERVVYNLSAKILVLKTQNSTTALICDNVKDVKKISLSKIKNIPYMTKNSLYKGVFMENDEDFYILDIDIIEQYIKNNPDKYLNEQSTQKYIINDDSSKAVLQERKNFLTKIAQDVQINTPLYDMGVSFSINNVKYYINMASVKEFFKVNNTKFIKVPSTPDFIYGLANIKGEYTTVLDIRRFFNNSKTHIKEKSTIIILNSNEFKLGILADEICESLNINFEEIIQNKLQKQEETNILEFVKDGEIYQVLDVDKLLQDEKLTIC